MQQVYDWTKFLLRIPIKATAEKLYDAWTTQQGLESWFLRKAAFTTSDAKPRESNVSVQVNDVYQWLWHGWPDDVTESGTVLEANGKDQFKFSFGKAGNVTVSIK